VVGTSFPVDGSLEAFAVGDVVEAVQPSGVIVSLTVAAIDRGRGFITKAGAPITLTRGTVIRKVSELVYDNAFVIMAKMPSGQEGGDTISEMVFTANEHGEGGMDSPQTGIVGRTIDNTNQDPPSREILISANAAPAVYRPIGCWSSSTVLF
jgi:hypothetical protein